MGFFWVSGFGICIGYMVLTLVLFGDIWGGGWGKEEFRFSSVVILGLDFF